MGSLIKSLAVAVLLLAGASSFAATRQGEACGDSTIHQAGYCPAVVQAVACAQTGSSTGQCEGISDETDGTRYVCLTTNSTPLTGPQIVACSGGTAIAGFSEAESGTNITSLTGLASSTTHYGQIVNLSPEGWYSNVSVAPASFTTASGGGGGGSGEPYDLTAGGTRTPPHAYAWPTAPTISDTTTCTAVTSAAQFNACADDAGTRITLASNISGNITIAANDIDVIATGYTVFGQLSMPSASLARIRWTGGTIRATGIDAVRQVNTATDVLFNNVNILALASGTGNSNVAIYPGSTTNRWAFINSTIRISDDQPGAWGIFTLQGTTHSNWILANVEIDAGDAPGPAAYRMQGITGVIVVDSAVNGNRYGSVTAHRFYNATNIWIADTIHYGFIHVNYSQVVGGTDVTNMVLENNDQYYDSPTLVAPASYAGTNTALGNTVHSSGGGAGGTPGMTGFTNLGGNTVVSWDGTTMPDISSIGADH